MNEEGRALQCGSGGVKASDRENFSPLSRKMEAQTSNQDHEASWQKQWHYRRYEISYYLPYDDTTNRIRCPYLHIRAPWRPFALL